MTATASRIDRFTALMICVLMAMAGGAHAQEFPTKPMRFYVGFPPGGSTDIISRLIAHHLQERLGQPVVVEQKIGATGVIAQDAVAKAAPDGHTFVLLTGGHPTSAVMMKKLPYDPVKDFGMISLVTQYPMTLIVNPASPISSMPDLIARAKAEPGKLTFSSAGIGSGHHLLGEWIGLEANIQMVHVPFKGATPALTELLGGRLDVMIETMTFSSGQIRSGRVRPLAIAARSRSPLFPEVPTLGETLKDVEFQSWLGIATSPGTPPPILERLNREVRTILALTDVKQRLADLGGEASPSSPDEMRSRVEREIARWTRVVDLRKIERQQ